MPDLRSSKGPRPPGGSEAQANSQEAASRHPAPPAGRKKYTPWHPLLARTLAPLVPASATLTTELQLNTEPQRIDMAIKCDAVKNLEPAPCLRSIFDRLNKITLIEFKSPLDRIDANTLPYVLSCAHRYEVLERVVSPSEITILVIADRLRVSLGLDLGDKPRFCYERKLLRMKLWNDICAVGT